MTLVSIKNNSICKGITLHAATLALGVAFLFPFLWMVSTALKPEKETMKMPPELVASEMQWGNFVRCLNYQNFNYAECARNTLYVCLLCVAGTLLSSSLVAYGFSRIQWRGRDAFFFLTLATMMIPFPVTMIPLYKIFRTLGWVGSFKPLWAPAFFGGAFNIFLLRQFFLSVPRGLSEAAHVDGAGEFRVYWQIILPLAKPAMLVVALFQFMASWNDFLGPLIYLPDQSTFTLAVGLQFFQSQHGGTDWNLLMAASTLVILPVIVLFFLTQKSFVEGISLTGLKG